MGAHVTDRLWNPTAGDGPSADVIELAASLKPRSVIDVGCGTGRNLLPFDRCGTCLYGIDISAESVAAARGRFQTHHAHEVLMTEVDLLAYEPDRSFDLVLCYGVLHFLDGRQRAEAYRRIRAWTSPGGTVSIVMFNELVPIPDDLRELIVDPPPDSSELLQAFSDWKVLRHLGYVYDDVHDAGRIRHRHAIDRMIAAKPS
jgi:SAM-dependent methyltransferase